MIILVVLALYPVAMLIATLLSVAGGMGDESRGISVVNKLHPLVFDQSVVHALSAILAVTGGILIAIWRSQRHRLARALEHSQSRCSE